MLSDIHQNTSDTELLQTGTDLFAGMQPAFRHTITGEAHLAQSKPGVPSSTYEFTALPDSWISERDTHGNAIALHPDVVPGYWRHAEFIDLMRLTAFPLDG
jgi:hypothetical protein